MHKNSMNFGRYRLGLIVAAMASASLLSACGGGGGDPPTQPDVQTQAAATGFWRGSAIASGQTQTASAAILPDGDAWIVFADTTGVNLLAHGDWLANTSSLGYSGSAQIYDMVTGARLDATPMPWRGSAQSQIQVTMSGDDTTHFGQVTLDTYRAQAMDATLGVAGVWRDVVTPGGTPTVDWVVDSAGALTGYSGGCTYAGDLTARQDTPAVWNAAVTETCASAVTALVGIVTEGADANSRNFTLVSIDGSQALLLALHLSP
jgi:hypothetical protein